MSNINDNALSKQRSTQRLSLIWLENRAVRIPIALLGLIVILVVMTLNVAKYETHLATGDSVLLELAPVDPRGFMQGDYMTLRYALEDAVLDKLYERLSSNEEWIEAAEGYVIVKLDSNKVGQFKRLADSKPANLATDEMAIHYRVRNGTMRLATNAFFFQEGYAKAFEAAEYGLFKVNKNGEPLLTDMVDDDFIVINPEIKSPED